MQKIELSGALTCHKNKWQDKQDWAFIKQQLRNEAQNKK